jgi:asparagine synthase (glutamine-hydrolysing)
MCGIIGQVRPPASPVDPELGDRMCALLEHRGPDARGIHREANVALGIQRLRVIDLDTGDQPVYNEDRSIVVVLNGEIYNYRELRDELGRRGHRLATRGDTEVIAHLYEEYGVDCVRRLHGMFAFALWDARRRQLLIARDRVGKKPLLYCLRDGVLSFASEMGALLGDEEIPRQVDHEALDAYLALGYVPAPLTALRGVRKLPPAHTLTLRDGKAELQRYWKLDYATKLTGVPTEELCERVRAGLWAATRRRMVADVPLGAFLSGGIDSSAVVAAMAAQSAEPVRTFSIGFDHQEFDELPHARRIAERFGTVHEEFQVRADAIEIVPKMVRHYGEPFADASAIPSFYLSELTRRHVTVALNGDGGDESFGGYTRYVANALAGRLDLIPGVLRGAVARAGARLPAGGRVTSVRNKARRLAGTLALERPERYTSYMSWWDRPQRSELYSPEFAAGAGPAAEAIAASWAGASGEAVIDKMLEVDVETYLVGDLIAKIDIATMAYGLEARSPFLDHELMQLAASIPASLKVRRSEKKWILREALRGQLPDEILDRPKQGFSVPLSSWLRTDLRSWARDVLLDPGTLGRGYFEPEAVSRLLDRHAAGADGDDKRIWSLLMLELWHREFVDSPASTALRAAA